ncbi:MAG TPA: ATP-binding protein [Opitutaceae bacterium]|nr:ATP-binding protein [Opitutaceae bacterium]
MIASGKGGTGKTTVATNLAATIAGRGWTVTYVDCDAEAPNGHLFLHPRIEDTEAVDRRVPLVDPNLCLHCGACAELCRFNAILCLPTHTVIYAELCHSCGGCALVCPANAIREEARPMGRVSRGAAGPVRFVSGTLDVGEANSPPVVRAAKCAAPATQWTILDAPPGTSCPMIETVRDCDYVVLVTEPTPFGLHDLRLAIAVARSLGRPCGVVVNRARPEAGEARTLCAEEGVPLLAEIPEDIAIARAYARGRLAVECVDGLRALFENLYRSLETAGGVPAAGEPEGRP